MTPAAILADLSALGITIRVDEARNLRAAPKEKITPEIRDLLVANKPAIIQELELEARRREVLQQLRDNPEIERAWVADSGANPVRVALAVRGVGTCELSIAAGRWDEFKFLELLEQQEGSA